MRVTSLKVTMRRHDGAFWEHSWAMRIEAWFDTGSVGLITDPQRTPDMYVSINPTDSPGKCRVWGYGVDGEIVLDVDKLPPGESIGSRALMYLALWRPKVIEDAVASTLGFNESFPWADCRFYPDMDNGIYRIFLP